MVTSTIMAMNDYPHLCGVLVNRLLAPLFSAPIFLLCILLTIMSFIRSISGKVDTFADRGYMDSPYAR